MLDCSIFSAVVRLVVLCNSDSTLGAAMNRRLAKRSIVVGFPALLALGVLLPLMPSCGSSSSPQLSPPPPPTFTLDRLSTDTFANPDGQHATELEPATFAFGSTLVTSFEVARGAGHSGGADIGFATSTDAGATWTSGFLSGLTTAMGGSAVATGNAVVTYDAAHGVWIISTLLANFNPLTTTLVVVRSSDGINWGNPITVDATTDPDKPWIVCDNSASSPFFGHCYVQWEAINVGTIFMSTSTDGGLTWGVLQNPGGAPLGGGGQPLVQPNGTVVVPINTTTDFINGPFNMSAFSSTDGGASWTAPVTISPDLPSHPSFDFRMGANPSARTDGAGNIYVVWADCRFRAGCSSNDLVISTSADGLTWTSPVRIPIDAVTSTVDHFTPGLAVDPVTSGSTAHLTVTFYSYTNANCTDSTCQLNLGFVSSQDGGNTWSSALTLAGPMSITWLPETSLGRDVGDYMSASYVNGQPFGVFAIAHANSGTVLDEAIYTTKQPLLPGGSAH